eukprot:6206922-Pleurochrysis_carterae.AAC.6
MENACREVSAPRPPGAQHQVLADRRWASPHPTKRMGFFNESITLKFIGTQTKYWRDSAPLPQRACMAPPPRSERPAARAASTSNTSLAVTDAVSPVSTPSPLPPSPKIRDRNPNAQCSDLQPGSARPLRRSKLRCSIHQVSVQNFGGLAQIASLTQSCVCLDHTVKSSIRESVALQNAEYIWTEIGISQSDPEEQLERQRAIIEKRRLNPTPSELCRQAVSAAKKEWAEALLSRRRRCRVH